MQKYSARALVIGVTLLTSSVAAHAQSPDPNNIYIQSITYGGTGCALGTIGTALNGYRTSATLILDDFVAAIGTGLTASDADRGCQINLNLRVPAGMSAAHLQVLYRGSTAVDHKMASRNTTTFTQGAEVLATRRGLHVVGKRVRSIQQKDRVPLLYDEPAMVTVPITVNIDTHLVSRSTDATRGFLAIHSVDIRLRPREIPGLTLPLRAPEPVLRLGVFKSDLS